eukprot:7682971-Pyramimonas_sp.AAC.1
MARAEGRGAVAPMTVDAGEVGSSGSEREARTARAVAFARALRPPSTCLSVSLFLIALYPSLSLDLFASLPAAPA